jgi:hypothetical protein
VKVKTALKRSKATAKFLGVILLVLLALLACFPSVGMAVLTALVALPFAGEVINMVYISRKSRKDPDYLDETIQ